MALQALNGPRTRAFLIASALLVAFTFGLGEYFGVWDDPQTRFKLNLGEQRLIRLPSRARQADQFDDIADGAEFMLRDLSKGHLSVTAWDTQPDLSGAWHAHAHWLQKSTLSVKFSRFKRWDWYVIHAANGSRVHVEAEFANCDDCRLFATTVDDTTDFDITRAAKELWHRRSRIAAGELMPQRQRFEAEVGPSWMRRGAMIIAIGSESSGGTGLAEITVDYAFPSARGATFGRGLNFQQENKYTVPVTHGAQFLLVEATRNKGVMQRSDVFEIALTEIPRGWQRFWRREMRHAVIVLDATLIVALAYRLWADRRAARALRPDRKKQVIEPATAPSDNATMPAAGKSLELPQARRTAASPLQG